MARVTWPLLWGRPRIEIVLTTGVTPVHSPRDLVADSGAGSLLSPFELILTEADCLSGGGYLLSTVRLGGAYTGTFRDFSIKRDSIRRLCLCVVR